MEKATPSFDQLIEIMAILRGPDGCPWDKEQNADTIKGHLIEEAYEVIEAINNKDYDELKEELGDLMLQVVFHSQLAKEEDKFDIKDVTEAINAKLIRRHPHIFADDKTVSKEEVLKRWEEIKREEKVEKKKEQVHSYLDGVPKGLPSLSYSQRLQTKAARVGFDWQAEEPVIDKIEEEISELREAMKAEDNSHIEKELGDLLFSVVNLARRLGIDAESALMRSSAVFTKRFSKMEALSDKAGSDFAKLTLAEKEALWNKAKKHDDS